MVSSDNQSALAKFLCERTGLIATTHLRCIGNVRENKILGVVGFENYNGASIMMHAAGSDNWVTKRMIWATFDYAFNVCKVNMVIGLVPSGCTEALRFNTHLGFKTVLNLDGAHPDGSLVLMTMSREECRYLTKDRHGQEILSPACT